MNGTTMSRAEMINLLRVIYKPVTQRRRRVHFASKPDTISAPNAQNFNDFKDDLFYGQEELMDFKAEAKQLARSGSLARGLEGSTLERTKFRLMSVRITVQAYNQGCDTEQTAMVSRRCSRWTEEVAFVQACHDYCAVYHPNMSAMLPNANTLPPKFPFESKKRASCSNEASPNMTDGRRIRRRTMAT